jgi:hypothetical protein
MKKKLILSTLAIAALAFTSCSRDDPTETPSGVVNIDANDCAVLLTSGQTTTLDPSITYKLTGSFVVEAGASLTIPAGTRIEAVGGTSSYSNSLHKMV